MASVNCFVLASVVLLAFTAASVTAQEDVIFYNITADCPGHDFATVNATGSSDQVCMDECVMNSYCVGFTRFTLTSNQTTWCQLKNTTCTSKELNYNSTAIFFIKIKTLEGFQEYPKMNCTGNATHDLHFKNSDPEMCLGNCIASMANCTGFRLNDQTDCYVKRGSCEMMVSEDPLDVFYAPIPSTTSVPTTEAITTVTANSTSNMTTSSAPTTTNWTGTTSNSTEMTQTTASEMTTSHENQTSTFFTTASTPVTVPDPLKEYISMAGDCPGNDYYYDFVSLIACAKRCSSEHVCAAFMYAYDFTQRHEICYLKNASCSLLDTSDLSNKLYVKKTGKLIPKKPEGYLVIQGLCSGESGSGTIRKLTSDGLTCAKVCNDTKQCAAFQMHKQEYCLLKNADCMLVNRTAFSERLFIRLDKKPDDHDDHKPNWTPAKVAGLSVGLFAVGLVIGCILIAIVNKYRGDGYNKMT